MSDVPPISESRVSPEQDGGKKKKKDRVRSAWISFIGRIVAQVVGAAASILLGLFILNRARTSDAPVVDTAAAVTSHRAERLASLRARPKDEVALAVLPLQNFSGDAAQDYFADGMTEALTAALAQTPGLRVISRTSAMYYKQRGASLPEIARQLNVDLVVEGSVVRSGNRVRITAQLIDAASDEHLWARNYDDSARDVLALQDRVATAIATEVRGAVAAESRRGSRPKAVDPEVYEAYLRGRYAWNARTPEGYDQAIGHFQHALEKDPSFAPAHAGLADVYQLRAAPGDRRTQAQARSSAQRALELDPELAEAHASLGGILHREHADVVGAEAAFMRAIALNGGYPTAHQWYAILLAEEGRADEAIEHARRAVLLDPLAAPMHQTLALTLYYARRYDEAVAAGRRALELAPSLPLARDLVARALIATGRHADAIALGQSVPPSADVSATLAAAYLRSGDEAQASRMVTALLASRPVPSVALARYYAATGDTQRAIQQLHAAVAARPQVMQQLKNDPGFGSVRALPAFQDLVPRKTPLEAAAR